MTNHGRGRWWFGWVVVLGCCFVPGVWAAENGADSGLAQVWHRLVAQWDLAEWELAQWEQILEEQAWVTGDDGSERPLVEGGAELGPVLEPTGAPRALELGPVLEPTGAPRSTPAAPRPMVVPRASELGPILEPTGPPRAARPSSRGRAAGSH